MALKLLKSVDPYFALKKTIKIAPVCFKIAIMMYISPYILQNNLGSSVYLETYSPTKKSKFVSLLPQKLET